MDNEKGGYLGVNDIYLGDCEELLKQIESNSIDLVITDPP